MCGAIILGAIEKITFITAKVAGIFEHFRANKLNIGNQFLLFFQYNNKSVFKYKLPFHNIKYSSFFTYILPSNKPESGSLLLYKLVLLFL